MPKERKTRSVSFERCSRASPFLSRSPNHHRNSSHTRDPHASSSEVAVADSAKEIKEWDDVRCPVCMEHPHNVVLLICSSHAKGCRPFMCDTSYRHSNCLDQFRKLFLGMEGDGDAQRSSSLQCPLCRGCVSGWTVVEAARRYMNAKVRSCSTETCDFSGTYGELRRHARSEHPSARPSATDPDRERDWRRMERQRNIGDLFSTLRSTIGHPRDVSDDGEGFEQQTITLPSFSIYFVLQVRQDAPAIRARSPRSPRPYFGWRGRSLSGRRGRVRRTGLWGETSGGIPLGSLGEEDYGRVDGGGWPVEVSPPRRGGGWPVVVSPPRRGSGWPVEVSPSARSSQRRNRRRLLLSEDEDDEDDDMQ